MIGFSDELDAFRGYFAENSDGNARPWEGMTHNEVFVNTELTTEGTYFVFEKLNIIVSQISKAMHISKSSVPLLGARST